MSVWLKPYANLCSIKKPSWRIWWQENYESASGSGPARQLEEICLTLSHGINTDSRTGPERLTLSLSGTKISLEEIVSIKQESPAKPTHETFLTQATVKDLGQFCSDMISDINAGRVDLREASKVLPDVTARIQELTAAKGKDPAAVALGRLGGLARAKRMRLEKRQANLRN
jgi:hypothetical protein